MVVEPITIKWIMGCWIHVKKTMRAYIQGRRK